MMLAMMKRGRIANPIQVQAPLGGSQEIPQGECWVLERPSWVLLMWRSASGPEQLEVPERDYAQHLGRGAICIADAR